MRKFNLLIVFVLLLFQGKTQTSTFITINSGGTFSRVTVAPGGCTSTTLNLCTNFTGSALSIALDGNILYIVDNKGFLYKNTLTNTGTVGNCTKIGQFISKSTAIYGLTVGPGGIVYAASGSDIETYDPSLNAFGIAGTLPNSWTIGGDMLFYQGKLYEAVKLTNGNNALIQINLTNVSNSNLYMNFNAGTSVFGFASVTVPCSNNQAYALSTVGNSTDIYAVDMTNKTQATTATCTLAFKVNDAASIAETQSATPPSNPIVTSPFNICQGNVINFPTPIVGSIKDTLRWYTQATGGSSYGKPTPKVDSSVLGTTTYYVSAFDTSTGCETPRQTMVVSVNPYPAVPTITPKDSVIICVGTSATLTSSAATGNQWNFNGSALSGATNITYTTNTAGNYTVTATTNKGCSKTSAITKVIVTDTLKSTNSLAVCQNQLPYTWNGLIFNSAGTQTKTGLKTVTGCDSSATLTLSIASVKNDILNLFDCDSIYYKGVWYSYPTTIYDTLKAVGGCDSVNLTIYISISSKIKKNTLNLSSCSSITYKSKTYTSSTSFTDTTKSYRGCDSVYTLVNINITSNVVKDTTKQLKACNQLTYKGNTYTTSTIILDSIVKTNNGNCDSIYHYIIIFITPITPTTNPINFNNCKSIIYKGNTYTTSTVVRDTVKSYQGCDSIYNVANIVITPVTPTTNPINFNNCKSITYKGNIYTTSTIVRDTVLSYQGCDSIYNVANIVINPITPANNNLSFIDCKQVVYKGKTYTSTVVVRDTVKSYQGCDSIYNVANIVINPITPANNNLSFIDCKQVVYKGKTYTSSAVVRDTLKSYQGCDSVYTIATIIINPLTPITKNKNFNHCNKVNYNGINYFSSTTIRDTLRSNGGCDSVYNITTITISPITITIEPKYYSSCDSVLFRGITYYSATIIADTIKSYQGCDSVYVQNIINILPKPTVSFNSNTVYILANTPITLKPVTTNASSYNWSPKIYLDDATFEFPVCTPLKDTVYKLVVYSDSGCKDSSFLRVLISKPVKIPTAFSPNGDGINDKWEIEFLNTYPQNTVQIFDRSGQLLYSSFPGSYKAWNGKYNGKDVPVGVYYYIIKLAPSLSLMSGYVTILR